MVWKKIHKAIIEALEGSIGEIVEGMRYGIPHVVGEVRLDENPPRVDVSVITFNGSRHTLLLREGERIEFLYPAEDGNPYVIFLELLLFFERNCPDASRFRVLLKRSPAEFLSDIGLELLWKSEYSFGGREYLQVWAVSEGARYNFLFEKTEEGFLLKDVKRIGSPQ